MVALGSLNDKLPSDLKESLFRPLMDNLNTPLIIQAVKIAKDREGEKATFKVVKAGDDKLFYLVTRANQPMRVARWLMENSALPIAAAFVMKGKAIFLVDPSEIPEGSSQDDIPF